MVERQQRHKRAVVVMPQIRALLERLTQAEAAVLVVAHHQVLMQVEPAAQA